MKLEEYILKRKTEDGINEFDRDKRAENNAVDRTNTFQLKCFCPAWLKYWTF